MIRYNWHFIILITLLLSAQNCKKQKDTNIDFNQIQGKLWLHSYEEDTVNLKAFRPEEYNFPPSRGRDGFKIEKDSIFIKYAIAPTDGWKKEYGKLQIVEDNKIKVDFNQKSLPFVIYTVKKASKDFLLLEETKVKK